MNPHVIFWVPAALRLGLIWTGSAVVWYFYGPITGLVAGLIAMSVMAVMQLHYLYLLNIWLDAPDSEKLPDGWGAWNAIFARLYRMHREEEKSSAELNEWLTRFRQAMNLLPDGVVIMTDVLFLEWCNPVAERHLGFVAQKGRGDACYQPCTNTRIYQLHYSWPL